MALFKILRGSIKNLPKTKTEGYMYITEDVGDIYVDMSNSKRIRLNAEAAEKIRKITYNSDGSYKSEVSFNYDDIAALQESNAALRGELQNKAPHKAGVYFVKGTGTKEGTWLGTSSDITEYYDGLTVAYEVGIDGASTTTLNINGLGAKTCYRYGTSKITTQHPVGSVILLVYSATKNAWYATDYDSNTNTQVRLYKDETGTYPIIGSRTAAGSVTSGSTAVYGEISGTNAITMTPSSGTITATTFSGNASSATKATQDGSGNIITSYYLPKATYTIHKHSTSYTPDGTISTPIFTGSAVDSGTPSGTVNVYSITGVGSAPSLTATVSNKCLTFTWSAGSVPTRSSVTVASSGHKHSVTAAGTISQLTFIGTAATLTTGTPS